MVGYGSSVPRPVSRSQVRLWDGRWWPCAGRYAGVPVFRYGWAPSGLVTVRQLAAKGLRPAGQDVAGWLVWGRANRPRWAYLYRLDLAVSKRATSPAQHAVIRAVNAARQVCRTCRRDVGYRIRTSLGECDPCAGIARGEQHEQHDNVEVQPGGYLRQDVPAGLGLPNHHIDSEENVMVELDAIPVGGTR